MILNSRSEKIRKFQENLKTPWNFSLLPRNVFLVPRLPSKMIILWIPVKNNQKLSIKLFPWCAIFYVLQVCIKYFVHDCIHFSWLLIVSIFLKEFYDMAKHEPSRKYYKYYAWLLCMFSIRKHIFSGIKQFFAQKRSKEIDVSNNVKINLSVYVIEKKIVLLNFSRMQQIWTNGDAWSLALK